MVSVFLVWWYQLYVEWIQIGPLSDQITTFCLKRCGGVVETMGTGVSQIVAGILASPFHNYVTSGKRLGLAQPQFPHP